MLLQVSIAQWASALARILASITLHLPIAQRTTKPRATVLTGAAAVIGKVALQRC